MKLKDRTGIRYGRLTVTGRAEDMIHPNGKKSTVWECVCDCGNKVTVLGSNLERGHVKSCGCISKDSPSRLKHGMANHRLYNIWTNMKQRCFNANNDDYKNYGGRGITVCDEWAEDFKNFADWALANGYNDELTIDRIDNNKGYEPNNCRWATRFIQRHNQNRLCDWEFIGGTK